MSFKIRKKFRNKITDFIIYILRIIVPIIAVIINGAMLVEFIKNQNTQDLSVFLTYTEITLTLFGFTMIAGIFEHKNRNYPQEYKQLFHLSIWFLSASISFLIIYFFSFIDLTDTWFKWGYLSLIVIAWIIGTLGFVLGLFRLLELLLEYSKKI